MDEIFEDPLLQTILNRGLITKERCAGLMVGKSHTITNVNGVLPLLLEELNQEKWLNTITEKLLSLQFVLQNTSLSHGGPTFPDFHYIPIPGETNGSRILHECEFLQKIPDEITKETIERSPLHNAPLERSRELCWIISYKTSSGNRPLLFLFTFDPHHLGRLRTDPKKLTEAKTYWESLAKKQSRLTGRENPPHLFLNAITGIHEWMNTIFPPKDPQEVWIRHPVNEDERSKAAILGLDLYYSNNLVTYGWSTLEKPKGRERSRVQLQQILNKRVILFDPIYGKSSGTFEQKKKEPKEKIHIQRDERDLTARCIWESTLMQADSSGCSDIHLEPTYPVGSREPDLIIALRKDNELNFHVKVPPELGENILRLALTSSGVLRDLTRVGQDGRKSWKNPKTGKTIDLRISVTPMRETGLQEVVIRLLDNSRLKRGLSYLGLESKELEIWERALEEDHSLILVSGPTGSGKSSTLFSAICDIHNKHPRRKFTSVEDPIEYLFPFRATQHQVEPEGGMSFADYIRRMVRNDIDTALVGEIRDRETLLAALQLGLTGHQILSTIHANSAAETVLRMLEFQPSPITMASVVKMIVAQRLAATPCPVCLKTIPASEAEEEIQKLGGLKTVISFQDHWKRLHPKNGDGKWKRNEGCPTCTFTGVQGKIAIQEFLVIDNQNRKHLQDGNVAELQKSMYERELHTLEVNAWKNAWLGKINLKSAGKLTRTLEDV